MKIGLKITKLNSNRNFFPTGFGCRLRDGKGRVGVTACCTTSNSISEKKEADDVNKY